MDSPVRKMLKRNDYNRHKLFRKIKRRRRAQAELFSRVAEKELKKKLRVTPVKYDDGKIAGYVRDKNDHPIAFDAEGNLVDQVAGEKGVMILPQVVVTPNRYNTTLKENDMFRKAVNFITYPIRKRFYKHFDPYAAYSDRSIARAKDLLLYGPEYAKKEYKRKEMEAGIFPTPYIEGAQSEFDDAVWGHYLRIPKEERKYKKDLELSKYTPTKGSNRDVTYYTIPIEEGTKAEIVNEGLQLAPNTNTNSSALFGYNMGYSTIGRGHDKNGDYVSYYDLWDINPLYGHYTDNSINEHPISKLIPKDGSDIFFGITNPISFYDRIYLDDYYDVPIEARGNNFLPEVSITGSEYKNGKTTSGIHIKPSHRGRLTALKKRTGKSEAELYRTGSAATRKMITFARNARKWNK